MQSKHTNPIAAMPRLNKMLHIDNQGQSDDIRQPKNGHTHSESQQEFTARNQQRTMSQAQRVERSRCLVSPSKKAPNAAQ